MAKGDKFYFENFSACTELAKKAAAYLRKNGYRILECNFSSHGKEIDIIAENKDFIVFCEVKTRKTNDFLIKKYGRPADAVNYYKQKNNF